MLKELIKRDFYLRSTWQHRFFGRAGELFTAIVE